MNRLPLLLACSISVFLSSAGVAARAKPVAATVILVEGEPLYFEQGHRHKLDLGQGLGKDCEVQTPKDSSLHLVLANGSSLVVGPNSRFKLETLDLPPARPRYQAKLLQGALAVMIDPEDQPLSLELSSLDASVVVKRARFELAAADGESRVTVGQGSLQFGDLEHKRLETVGAMYSCGLFNGRLEHANRLAKREANAYQQRWQRSTMIHGQRKQLLKNLRSLQ